jgi:hypothetical protein
LPFRQQSKDIKEVLKKVVNVGCKNPEPGLEEVDSS